MATAQLPKPRPGRASDEFVRREIDRASWQIRAHDLWRSGLWLLALTLAYAAGTAVLDRAFVLSDAARQLGLAAFGLSALAIALAALVRPLRQTVNPYFAARQIERAVPDAKNSLVNWLDLKDSELPSAVRGAIDARAARDLGRVDVEAVTRDRGVILGGGTVVALAIALIIMLCLFRPGQFLSLLVRAFAPFTPTPIATSTQLDLLQPANGDLTVAVNTSVGFRVLAGGRVPRAESDDAIRLRWRYNPDDTVWDERKLDNPDGGAEWAVRLPAAQVQNGFQYQIVGGDAATPVYTVSVRSSPLVTEFEARYKFRPYLRYAEETRRDPNLRAVRGTEVKLIARTNRNVRDGWLKFTADANGETKSVAAERLADDPSAMLFPLQLEASGKYRIRFTDVAGDESDETLPFTVEVLGDQSPQVEVTQPAPETLPVYGTLSIGGRAVDDFGLTAVRLMMRLRPDPKKDEPVALAGKPFPVAPAADGSRPRTVEYQDFVGLDALTKPSGAPVEPKAGMVLEYWLEADDNCDYPKANVGQSPVFRVTLGDPQSKEQQQKERQKAEQQKQDHQQKQGEQQPNPGEQKPDEPQPQPGDKAGEPKDGDQAKNGQNGEGKSEPKPGDNGDAKSEPKLGDRQQKSDKNGGQNQTPDDKKLEDTAKKIQDELKKREQQGNADPNDGQQPQPKPGEQQPGEQQPQPKDGDQKPGRDPNPGGNTDEPNAKPADMKKPNTPKPDGNGQPSKSPDAGPKPDAGRAPEVDQQMRDHQNGNDQQKKQAEQKLQDLKENAADPKTRDDAGQALEELKNQQSKPGDGQKSPDNAQGRESRPADPKQPGDKPEMKSGDGSPPKPGDKPEPAPKDGDAKPQPGQLPPDLQQKVNEFKQANEERQKQIQDELRDMAKKPQSPERKQQLDDAMKECNCDNGGASGKSGKPKPGGDGQGQDNTSASDNATPKPSPGEGQGQEKTGRKPDGGQPKPGEQTADGPDGSKPEQGRPGDQGKSGADQKSGDKGQPKGNDAKAKAGDKPAKPDGASDKGGPDGPGRKAGSAPNGGNPEGDTVGGGVGGDETGGEAVNEDFTKKAGELQLESFRKKVDRDILRDLNMTEEEYRQFLKAYEAMLKKRAAGSAGDKVRGQTAGGSAANAKTRKVDPGKAGPATGDRFGAAQAPPEFREQYKEFAEDKPKK